MSKYQPKPWIYHGVGSKRAEIVDPHEGRIGYYPCPHCGRYEPLNNDYHVRKHDFLGPDRIPCPGGRVHPGRFR